MLSLHLCVNRSSTSERVICVVLLFYVWNLCVLSWAGLPGRRDRVSQWNISWINKG